MALIEASELQAHVPPHNLEAEMSSLGTMLLSEKACEDVLGILKEDEFSSPAHRGIVKAIHQRALNSKAVDVLTLKNELLERGRLQSAGGVDYLLQIQESVPSAANAPGGLQPPALEEL